jgi:hypothetical protein
VTEAAECLANVFNANIEKLRSPVNATFICALTSPPVETDWCVARTGHTILGISRRGSVRSNRLRNADQGH